jgi:hypothetical protein
MQVTLDAETHELLRDVQALLGHTVPSGDLAAVLRESLRLAKQALERVYGERFMNGRRESARERVAERSRLRV